MRPGLIGDITVRNFRLGDAAISFAVRPHANGTISLSVLESKGNMEISVAIDAPHAQGRPGCRVNRRGIILPDRIIITD